MYCPKCSQQQLSDEVRFCSRCGFLLTGITEVIKNNGIIPNASDKENKKRLTPRRKGLKKGLFLLLLAILLLPILMIFAKEMSMRPAFFILSIFILFAIGIVRMLYARMFESDEPSESDWDSPDILAGKGNIEALPPAQSRPAADFVPPLQGNWRGSDELVFSGVTDVTTKQLDKK